MHNETPIQNPADNKLWVCMLQLGMKMWIKRTHDELLFDRNTWNEVTEKLRDCGCNAIMLDIGEGMLYDRRPELSVKGAWTKAMMREEIARLKDMGIELFPKLNFSTAHDMWLGDYAKRLGTREYYEAVADVIDEVCEVFEPRFFHIGMDEENYGIEKSYPYVRIRQGDLWWNDLLYYIACVEKHGVRPMMWSDYARHAPDEFVNRCPKSVIQNVWYYGTTFDMADEFQRIRIVPYDKCEEMGFDQIPTATNFYRRENLRQLTAYCTGRISDDRLFGFMQTPWHPTIPENKDKLFESAETLREARLTYEALFTYDRYKLLPITDGVRL